jgi:hypothetical protein
MIPAFLDSGFLPPGIHQATVTELEDRFARFERSDRRIHIYAEIRRLFEAIRRISFIKRVFVAGSFVTAKPEPNDFDCLIVIDYELFPPEVRPFEYQVISRREARRIFRGDVVSVVEGTDLCGKYMQFFQSSRDGEPIGMVEVLYDRE